MRTALSRDGGRPAFPRSTRGCRRANGAGSTVRGQIIAVPVDDAEAPSGEDANHIFGALFAGLQATGLGPSGRSGRRCGLEIGEP